MEYYVFKTVDSYGVVLQNYISQVEILYIAEKLNLNNLISVKSINIQIPIIKVSHIYIDSKVNNTIKTLDIIDKEIRSIITSCQFINRSFNLDDL